MNSGRPPHIGARMKKSAYGLNDAPRRWWNILNILDSALRSYGLAPTRADRRTYVYYGKKKNPTLDLEGAVDYLMDPVSGSNTENPQAHGALSLHVDDLLLTGADVFEKEIMGRLRKDKNDCLFAGQRIQWKHDDKHGWYTNVHQNVCNFSAIFSDWLLRIQACVNIMTSPLRNFPVHDEQEALDDIPMEQMNEEDPISHPRQL